MYPEMSNFEIKKPTRDQNLFILEELEINEVEIRVRHEESTRNEQLNMTE